MIRGTTQLIAHIGVPTDGFIAPMIYNPYFEQAGIDAVVVPMGSRREDFPQFFKLVFRLTNIRGALITMPHKVAVVGLVDELSSTAKVAGSCNAVKLDANGKLVGDMFDGEGFVRGVLRKGRDLLGARTLVVGTGGVGSAIAASLAKAGVAEISIFDQNFEAMAALSKRLQDNYPNLRVTTGSNDPSNHDLVVNATPLGMNKDDALPMDVSRLNSTTLVGEVVMKQEITPFLAAARARGCTIQIGTDMLFEQIPVYLEFFGFPTTTAEELRRVARIDRRQ
jgi:shikimate dehydrogenase